jgi:hypothetical protein
VVRWHKHRQHGDLITLASEIQRPEIAVCCANGGAFLDSGALGELMISLARYANLTRYDASLGTLIP